MRRSKRILTQIQISDKRNAPLSENSDSVEKPHEELIHIPSIPISQPADMTTDKILKQAYQLEVHHSNGTVAEVQQTKSAQPSQNAPPLPPKSKKKKNEMAQYQQLSKIYLILYFFFVLFIDR